MPKPLVLMRLAALAACVFAAVWMTLAPSPRKEAVAQQQQFQLPRIYFGAGSCVDCHSNPKEDADTDFCLLNESDVWSKQDKHSQAYEVLTWDHSKRMGEILGIADVTKANECLSCHAVVANEAEQGRNFRIEDGVSCDACHGPSGLWYAAHANLRNWRTMPPEQKEQQFGMKDVRDPAKRAKMCMSCHIGNTEEGKVVTHEMYAAGHPPLPGFEIETFVERQPKHWRYLEEKPENVRELFDFDPSVQHRAELVVFGGLMALRESVQLFGSQAEKQQSQWPELAQFDCYACHHDLRKPEDSWRLARGYESWRLLQSSTVPPGRPQMREWTSALAILALRHAGQTEQQILDALAPLHQTLSNKPYGDFESASQSAGQAVAWLDEQIAALSEDRMKAEDSTRLLKTIAEMGSSADHTLDYDSARQLAWAFQIVHQERYGDGVPEAAELLKELDELLHLELPSGLDRQIMDHLPKTLQTLNDYDPEPVKRAFASLAETIQ